MFGLTTPMLCEECCWVLCRLQVLPKGVGFDEVSLSQERQGATGHVPTRSPKWSLGRSRRPT